MEGIKVKEFKYKFTWTDNDTWMMPDSEEVCQKVLFPQLEDAIAPALAMTEGRDVCIQAGGFIGE